MQVVDFVVISLAIVWLIVVFSMLDIYKNVSIMKNNSRILQFVHS